jgi:hypothetical protein
MRTISLLKALPIVLVACSSAAYAQTSSRPANSTASPPANVKTQQKADGPFGTQWAKPPGTTGSQIYNDPRGRDPNSSYRRQRSKPCPAPTISDSAGGCR